MSRPRGMGVIARLVYNYLSNKNRATGHIRDRIFGPVNSHLEDPKLLPGQLREVKEPRVVGSDYLGNKYWELEADPARGRRLPKRWYWPENEDDWDRPVPPEWEAWLRYRREDLPSDEEIRRNIAIAQLKKIRAKELQENDKKVKDEAESLGLEAKAEPTDESKTPKEEKPIVKDEEEPTYPIRGSLRGTFPVRGDMEATPGSSKRARKTDHMYDPD